MLSSFLHAGFLRLSPQAAWLRFQSALRVVAGVDTVCDAERGSFGNLVQPLQRLRPWKLAKF
jgi:hypothetical protein